MLQGVSADRLSIAQVTPHRRGTRNALNEYVSRVSEELERRGHEVLVLGSGDAVKRRLASSPFDVVHVHDPFAPRISSTALRHSFSLNVATFHAPQERVLSTQVARPLVEIFFGRLDARTVAAPTTAERLERYFAGPYEVVEGAGEGRGWAEVAAQLEAIYLRIAARRHSGAGDEEARRRIAGRPLIEVDLHMHTDHSHDCVTPVDVLLSTARERGLGAIAVTDHNEISGAHDARAKAAEYGVKLIVGEEVKTADQGEVIGLFIEEKIPRGMTLEETIAEIKRQGGLVYVPHPFDRMHAVPDYEHLLGVIDDVDAIEVYNPRVAVGSFNEEAVRFAAKYRIPAGAGSDAHVVQGLGSARIRMRDFDGPDEFLESLRDADIVRKPANLLYVQALKFLQTKSPLRRKS